LAKSSRRRARIIALQALYEIDASGHETAKVTEGLLQNAKLSDENTQFSRELIEGVIKNIGPIDEEIKKHAPAWPLHQVPFIDRNILRLAIFEILLDNKTPVKVAIDEAVELAKAFGSDNSAKFVNGVLGAISALVTRK